MNKFVYINPRPALLIESAGGGNIGRCYNAMTYRVTSRKPLDMAALVLLRQLGFLGYGQEFYAHQTFADPTVKRVTVPQTLGSAPVNPSGVDGVPCSEVDALDNVVACPGINPYSGVAYEPHAEPYYTYHCESRVDSSG